MAQPQKETILGNYLKWSHFPLDCESMDYIQENIKHLAMITQIAGYDTLILNGCTLSGGRVSEGYVYLRTGNDLVGEIFYYPGGTGTAVGPSDTPIDTIANNEPFTAAYTKRTLKDGAGSINLRTVRKLSAITNKKLYDYIDEKADDNHNHDDSYYLKTEMDTKLADKATKNHTHYDRYYTETEMDSKLALKAEKNHTHPYANTSHIHSISEITDLQSSLEGKADKNHTHSYAASNHNHDTVYYKKTEVYTKSEVDDKIKVTEASNMFDGDNIHCYKQGKFVFCSINSLTGYRGSNTNGEDNREHYIGYLDIPSGFRPKMIVFGVGIGTTTNELSVKNHMQFWIKPDGRIFWRYFVEKIPETGDYANGYNTISASICYITD